MSRKTIFIAISLLVAAGILLAGCGQPAPEIVEVEKTVVLTREVFVDGTTVVQEVVVTAIPEPTQEKPPEERTLVICLGQEPESVYSESQVLFQVLAAVAEDPFNRRSYGYQVTILEKLPSLADGDAVIETVAVADGDLVVGDDWEVHALEAGVVVRPADCRASDCAITYAGGGLEMDRMVVTFKLLPGLLWSDGAPLTASDSIYNFNLDAGSEDPSGSVDVTASYQALDDVTVVWTGLPGHIVSTYNLHFWPPSPEHVQSQYTAEEWEDILESPASPVYGPYIFDEWIRGDRMTLHKNPNYRRADEGLPRFDRLVYRFVGQDSNANIAAILSGECDIVDSTSALDDQSEVLLELEAAGLINAAFMTTPTWEHVEFNITPLEGSGFAGWDEDGDGLGPFGDVRLRRAVAMCMDRQAVVDTVFFGQSIVLDTYIPPEDPLFNAEAMHYPFDVAAASALLDEIGWIDDDGDPATPRLAQGVTGVPDGTPLEFAYETTSAIQRQRASQILADSMAQCGIRVNLEYYPAGEWLGGGPEDVKTWGRRFDLGQFAYIPLMPVYACGYYLTTSIPGPPDEINPYTGALYNFGWGGGNIAGYSNPEFDATCKATWMSLPGEAAYAENYLKAQEIFARELPDVPLYPRLKVAATRPDMCNFILDPSNLSDMWNIAEFDYGPSCGEGD